MTLKTFKTRGMDYVSELGLKNASDIIKILKWNFDNEIYFFRLSSIIIPWGDSIDITRLKDYDEISGIMKYSGHFANMNGIRITSHPGPFTVLTSPKESVVENSIKNLEFHGLMFDMLNLSRSPYNKINIHCNGVYGDKKSAMDRFCDNFQRLSPSVQSRLTIENDDKESMYSVKDLMYIHERIGIPIVFDELHHKFCTGGLNEDAAIQLAISTWPDNITPVVHYSESRALYDTDKKVKPQAHSDYVENIPIASKYNVDIMLECKMKELAVLRLRNKYNL